AAEPQERPEAVAVALGELDRGGPVGLDAEIHGSQPPAVPAGREHDGYVCDRAGAVLELRGRLARGEATDIDARDAQALGDPPGRARERKAQDDAPDDEHGRAP